MMEILPLLCIVSLAFTGLTKGAGVLPDGPLNATVGETVMFTTTLTPTINPLFSVNWRFGDRDIITLTNINNTAPEYEGRITLFIFTGSLELRNVALNDGGEYSVSVLLSGGSPQPGNIRLNVYEPVSNVKATANPPDFVEFSSSVRLSCSSSGSSLSFLWLNDTSEVTESDRVQLTDGGSSLTILNVTLYDQGPFRCLVSNPVSNGTSDPVKLNIIWRISNASVTPSTNLTIEGNSVNLTCDAAGSVFTREWMKDGLDLSLSDNMILYHENRVLSFNSLKKSDSGEYSCNISNSINSEEARYTMVVYYGPDNVHITGPSEIRLGETLILTCSADSTPSAGFTWMLNGTEIHNSAVFTKNNTELSDTGNYTCQAMNNITEKKSSAVYILAITGRISGASVTPSTNLTIEGNSVNLTCDAAGSVFTREWMKDGLDLSLSDNMILYHENRVLSFNSLKKSDSGEYSCNISNSINSEEARYTMVVYYGPDNVHITGPSETRLGETLILTCSADSTPSAGFTWMLNGTEIHNSAVFTKNNTELSDTGNYTCQAMNNITEEKSSAVYILAITDTSDNPTSCSAGCIAGIVVACSVVLGAAVVAGFFIYKKGKCTKKLSSRNTTRMEHEGQDNGAYSRSQELEYADVRVTKNKHSRTAEMGLENNSTTYAEIRVNNSPPGASSPPTYDAHMQRMQTTAP